MIFIKALDLKEVGAAIATNLTYILNMAITDILIRMENTGQFRHMVFFYDTTVNKEIRAYLRIGVPRMLILCFEYLTFGILTIFAGLLGVKMLATEVILFNLTSFIFMVPLGISYLASAFTGYFLGEGKIDYAKRFSSLCVLYNLMVTTVICILIGIYSNEVSQIFTDDQDVLAILKDCTWILIPYIWLNTIHKAQ